MEAQKRYCCPKEYTKEWANCRWYGEPGSCFDNHCPAGHHVQFTDSPYGLGMSCFPRLERNRVFCCEPKGKKKNKFLPVSLDNLFKDPPKGDKVDVNHEIKVDKTRGHKGPDPSVGKDTKDSKDEINDSSFGFWVMASPTEIQTTLRAVDGSHWDVFNCPGGTSEELQTAQMICTDVSEKSNCGKISLGRGVPGTILEMPDECGHKYAVAHSMKPSKNQSLPHHLRKRDLGHKPVVYDLKYDYEWSRVPQEFGNTQMRLDFSNEEVSLPPLRLSYSMLTKYLGLLG